MMISSLRSLLRGEIPSFTSGDQIWDFLYVDDAACALADMLERGHDGQIYVVGSGKSRPLREYISMMLQPFDVTIAQCLGRIKTGNSTPRFLAADVTPLREHLGWSPQVDFNEGLGRTIAYCRAHPA